MGFVMFEGVPISDFSIEMTSPGGRSGTNGMDGVVV
jgi:hypothetical protein